MRNSRVTHTMTEYINDVQIYLTVDEIVDEYGDFVKFEDLFVEVGNKHELLDPNEDQVTDLVQSLGFDNLFDLCESIADNGNIEYNYDNEYEE